MKYILTALVALLLAATQATGAAVAPDPGFTLDVPGDWQSTRDAAGATPEAVKAALECVDEKPLMTGWKLGDGAVQGAFCVSYWRSGGGKTLRLLKTTSGSARDEAFGTFADIFASKIHAGYRKRQAQVSDLSATLLSAGEQVISVIDGRVRHGGKTYMRSDTVYLRGDAILCIGTIYDVSAPPSVGAQTDALPLSVEWKR